MTAKREAKKMWESNRTKASREAYKVTRKRTKQEVAKVKKGVYEELYQRLETKEDANELFRIAKQRDRDSKNV